MPFREGGRVRGGWWLLLVGLVAVAGCGAGPPDPASRFGPGGGEPPGPSAVPVRGGSPPDLDSVRPPQGGTGILPLTFIGFVESPGIGRVVVLTDGEIVFHGLVGDVIGGRYRILRLGLESVDVEQVDGQGQQTLRLPSEPSSGS